ncbi:hypothetical protein DBR42_16265, partial [Pelomonas sp. HMWF004]
MTLRRLTLLPLLAASALASAAPQPYTGADYSGRYDCQGLDDHEGPYAGTVTLALVREQSSGRHGAYRFELEVPGYGRYPGQAASNGAQMAIHFVLTDPSTQDYGTGIATFSKTRDGRWQFRKWYYQPAFKGGNFGSETC